MSKLTYAEKLIDGKHIVKVRLDGKLVGTIRQELSADGVTDGYRYYPIDNKLGGDLFETLRACKRSLEN